MHRTPTISDLLGLSVAERILLVQDLWDSISEHPEAVDLTDAQRQELDARIQAYHDDPTTAFSWEEVKARTRRGR